jgi:hypothetical protein
LTLISGALIVALAVAGVLVLRSLAGADPQCNERNGFGSFDARNQPGACWRPYNDSSPFNRRVPARAPLVPHSARYVDRLLATYGGPAEFVVGDPARDAGVPIFWSQQGDPRYRLHCTKPWGRCELEGLRIRIPPEATPAGGFSTRDNEHDAHMTVIDQRKGVEYDMWQVQRKRGSRLEFSWGGKTRIDGNGLGSDAVAARYGTIAGPIRFTELRDGLINHALTIAVPCTDTQVYPAVQTGAKCRDAGISRKYSIPMGAHFRLTLSPAQIDALGLPPWKRTVATALATYGAYVSDTTSLQGAWGIEIESGQSYVSFGLPDPWVEYARSVGIVGEDFDQNGYPEYRFHISQGIPWERLRVVSVCAARGTCSRRG